MCRRGGHMVGHDRAVVRCGGTAPYFRAASFLSKSDNAWFSICAWRGF